MPRLVEKCCEYCQSPMTVRSADVKRGWGRFCSKACKAKEQEARTGQYSNLLRSGINPDHGHGKSLEGYGPGANWCHPFEEDAFNP
jgi:hypothetical protein